MWKWKWKWKWEWSQETLERGCIIIMFRQPDIPRISTMSQSANYTTSSLSQTFLPCLASFVLFHSFFNIHKIIHCGDAEIDDQRDGFSNLASSSSSSSSPTTIHPTSTHRANRHITHIRNTQTESTSFQKPKYIINKIIILKTAR